MNWKLATAALVGGCAVYVALAFRSVPIDLDQAMQTLRDPVSPAQAELSGTRLKAKYISGADGSELFEPERLYDSTLDADCEFRVAADGVSRCLPTLSPGADSASPWYFSDSGCTTRIVFVSAPALGCAAQAPKYVYTNDAPPSCQGYDVARYHIYATGSLIATPSPVYTLSGTTGVCNSQSAPNNRVAFSLDAEMPASSFVEGTAGIDP